MMHPLFFG